MEWGERIGNHGLREREGEEGRKGRREKRRGDHGVKKRTGEGKGE